MHKRSVSIDYIIIEKALKSKSALEALAFVLILKTNYTNSALYQWSYNKVMNLCHCRKDKAKDIVTTAMKMGWVVEKHTKEGHKYLVAIKLSHKNQDRLVFNTANSKAGLQIYISKKQKSSLLGLRGSSDEQKSARLILKCWDASDMESYEKAKKSITVQTFKDVRQKIVEAYILNYLKSLWNPLNTCTEGRMGAVNKDALTFARKYMSHGVSYTKIANKCGKLGLSEYQTSRIVKSLRKDGLIRCHKASELFFVEKEGINDIDEDFSQFKVFDDNSGQVIDMFPRCYRNKWVKCKPGERHYYIKRAVWYEVTATVSKPKRKRRMAA